MAYERIAPDALGHPRTPSDTIGHFGHRHASNTGHIGHMSSDIFRTLGHMSSDTPDICPGHVRTHPDIPDTPDSQGSGTVPPRLSVRTGRAHFGLDPSI